MKCSCCGRKKKLMESFENIGEGGDVCVDCSDLLYRIHDAVTEKQKDVYDQNIKSINNFIDKKKASEEFGKWYKDNYLKRNIFVDK